MNASHGLADDATLRRSDLQVSVDLDGETVLLHTETGQFFELNNVGAVVWGLLVEPNTLDELMSTLVEMFEPPAEGDQRSELVRFVTTLADVGVVDVS